VPFSTSFGRFAKFTSRASGHPSTFALAVGLIIVWGTTGPVFHFSDTWQLFINTGTTIVTFLMVFLIQNTQNRDSAAMHVKLDELLRAVQGAETGLADLEDLTEEELDAFKRRYVALAKQAKDDILSSRSTEMPDAEHG
jgi:low affinity Fe/Cu permease